MSADNLVSRASPERAHTGFAPVDAPARAAGTADGSEPFRVAGERLGLTLLDFWRWCGSDLLDTSTRGRLAEFIVAALLDANAAFPRAGRAFEIRTADGIAVRVKSAAAPQGAFPREKAKIYFMPLVWRASRRSSAAPDAVPAARAYVFALLRHARDGAPNPLDVDQWVFLVPPTARLEAKMERQRALSLAGLEHISAGAVPPGELREAVRRAARAGA